MHVVSVDSPSQVVLTPPDAAVTRYSVIGAPPSDADGDHVTVSDPSPATIEVMTGASGRVGTVAPIVAATLAPIEFSATTSKL